MRRILTSLAAVSIVAAALVVLVSAQDKAVSLTGSIVDKACSARHAKAPDPMVAAAGHTKKCALMPNCAGSGFGVFADGKFYEFDSKGNDLAKEKLEASKKDAGAKFKVEGTLHEDKLAVKSISELD
jgi:hypothetical protein